MINLTVQRTSKLGISMSELARKAEMHVSTISQIESGRLVPYPGQIAKLVAVTGWTDEPMKLFEEAEGVSL